MVACFVLQIVTFLRQTEKYRAAQEKMVIDLANVCILKYVVDCYLHHLVRMHIAHTRKTLSSTCFVVYIESQH